MAKLLTVSIAVLILFAAYTATQNTPGPTKSPPVDSIFDEIKSLNCTATDPNTCNADHIKVNTSAKDVCDRLAAAKICTDNCAGNATAVKDSLDKSWKNYTCASNKSDAVNSIFDKLQDLNCTAKDNTTCKADHIIGGTSATDVCARLTATKTCTDNCTKDTKEVKDLVDKSWKDYNCDNTDEKGDAVNSIFDKIKNLNCTAKDLTKCKTDHIKGDTSPEEVCARLTDTKICTDNCTKDAKEVKDSLDKSWKDYKCDKTDAKGDRVNSIFDQIKNLNCTAKDPTTCKADHITLDTSAKEVCARLKATKTCTDHCSKDTKEVKDSLDRSLKDYNCDSCSLLHGSGLLLILAALVNRLL